MAPAEPTFTASAVATPVPNPVSPLAGYPVQLVNVPEVGVPNKGVVKVGDVAKTSAPVPVSSVIAVRRLADVGDANHAATPVPNPVIDPTAGVMVTLEAAVSCPSVLTAKNPTCVAEPYVAAATPVTAIASVTVEDSAPPPVRPAPAVIRREDGTASVMP